MTFGEDKDPALVDMIARWVIAMPYVLKAHVTEMKDLTVQLKARAPILHRALSGLTAYILSTTST